MWSHMTRATGAVGCQHQGKEEGGGRAREPLHIFHLLTETQFQHKKCCGIFQTGAPSPPTAPSTERFGHIQPGERKPRGKPRTFASLTSSVLYVPVCSCPPPLPIYPSAGGSLHELGPALGFFLLKGLFPTTLRLTLYKDELNWKIICRTVNMHLEYTCIWLFDWNSLIDAFSIISR